MKSTNLFCLTALMGGACFFAEDAKAQDAVYVDEAVTVTEYTCDNTNRYYQSWRDNWFIQLGAGITQPFVEHGIGLKAKGNMVDKRMMTVMYDAGFGHWFSPYLGWRLHGTYGAIHWDNPTLGDPHGWSLGRNASVNAELMWDMCNSIAGVNPNRVVSVIPYVGIGGNCMWNVRDKAGNVAAGTNIYDRDHDKLLKKSWTLPVNAGLQLRFRLCKYVDFFAEVRSAFYGDNWNLCADGDAIDAQVSVLGGFNINIGGRGWDTYNECGYMSQIAGLNGQVNDLRAQLLNAGQTIAALESQLPCDEPQVVEKAAAAPMMTTVRFHINSYDIQPEEQVNVYNVAQWLKANPDQKIVVVGYADKDTGTAEYNLNLSKERADAVANELVKTYGIDKDRLTVKYDGSSVQPYSENDWNRIVIFSQE